MQGAAVGSGRQNWERILDLPKQQVTDRGKRKFRARDRGWRRKQGLGFQERGQKPDIGVSLPLVRLQVWEAAAAADGPGFEGQESARAVSPAAWASK